MFIICYTPINPLPICGALSSLWLKLNTLRQFSKVPPSSDFSTVLKILRVGSDLFYKYPPEETYWVWTHKVR